MEPTMAATTTTVSVSSNGAATRSPAALWPPTEKQLEFIEEMTTNVDAVQERVLAEILARNADSEYLAVRCGLAGATDRATFRAKVPLVTYEDLKPYVMRVANGDKSPILTGCANPISMFFSSSGTSGGKPKLIPVVKDDPDRRMLIESLATAVLNQHDDVSGFDKGQNRSGLYLYFYFVRPETMTPGGLPVRSAQTSRFKRWFKELAYGPCSTFTSPPAAILCEDVFQSMYAQVLCGLCHRHAVVRIGAPFASGVVRAFVFLQLNWRQLAADIEAGTLNQCITDLPVREAVAGVLRPDPELAQFIRTECADDGDWAGIVRRIWPNARYIDAIGTGSMAQYVPTLNYYSGDLPIASTRYSSSECSFGINLQPMSDPSDVCYTFLPNMGYFEFLPVDVAASATAGDLVELAGVEVGHEYEVVATTYRGLNRYRVSDVVRVTGFHNAAPQFQFIGRKKVLLSIDTDKTEEVELQRAVERASTLLHPHGAVVLDYTSRTSTKNIPGHYVIYWELRFATHGCGGGPHTQSMDGDVLSRCCLQMEEALGYIYRRNRAKDGSIGPLEIQVVRPGTFQELADYAVCHGGTAIGQYKVPRSVTHPAIIQLLDSRVVSSHFSPSLPHWAPGQRFESNGEKC